MADLSQPGSDGTLSCGFEDSGFKDWHYGTVYTVRPEMLSALEVGREYRLVVAFRRKVSEDPGSYADLYQLVRGIATTRVRELGCAAWIVSQAWGCRVMGGSRVAAASVTLGLASDGVKSGENPASGADLLAPRDAKVDPKTAPRYDEVFNIFDFREPVPARGEIGMFSYGEFVVDAGSIDYASVVERAELRVCAHYGLERRQILRREWLYATDPDMAVVHVYFEVAGRAVE